MGYSLQQSIESGDKFGTTVVFPTSSYRHFPSLLRAFPFPLRTFSWAFPSTLHTTIFWASTLHTQLLLWAFRSPLHLDVALLLSTVFFLYHRYGSVFEAAVDEMFRQSKLTSDHKFLDIGCGIGSIVLQAAGWAGCQAAVSAGPTVATARPTSDTEGSTVDRAYAVFCFARTAVPAARIIYAAAAIRSAVAAHSSTINTTPYCYCGRSMVAQAYDVFYYAYS